MLSVRPKTKNGVLAALSYDVPAAKKLVLYMKDHYDEDAFRYSAQLLLHRLLAAGVSPHGYTVTFAPRSPLSRLLCRFDQSEEIAKALSREIFGDASHCVPLVSRSFFSRPQKSLDAEERAKNVKRHLRLKTGAAVPERIILLDDVTTTGATLERIAQLFYENGAKECLSLVLAAKPRG